MRLYPVGLVGESHFRIAISACHTGMRVYICHEHDNPYDDLALRVDTADGLTIGYIPRSNWLREAIHEEGRGATCTISSLNPAPGGNIGVVLDATLTDDDIPIRDYRRDREAAAR